MDWLENKYVNLLSSRLSNFKRKGNGIFNFRCPVCGDSAVSKSKARGYIYEKQGKSAYYCHNCGASMGVPNFIKFVDPLLYNEYKLEKLRNTKTLEQIEFDEFVQKMKKPVFMKSGPLKGLKKISQLDPDHPLKKFVVARKIPNEYHAKLFSCPNFMRFTNSIIPDKFSSEALRNDETRLLIPFLDSNKSLHAFQGRTLNPKSKSKYITIVLDENVPKIFGLDTVSVRDFDKSNLVIVYDNEKRNKETVKKIDKAIMNGYNVCIWPENLEHKDVNDMVLAGLSPEFITHIIKTNTYRDLAAKLKLQQWSRA